MNKGLRTMYPVSKDQWPFGYFYFEKGYSNGSNVYWCEVHFCFDKETEITIFVQVCRINTSFKKYEVFFFEGEAMDARMLMYADVDYVDSFSNSVLFEFSRLGIHDISWKTEKVIRMLHPLIWRYLIQCDHSSSQRIAAYGFTEELLTWIEDNTQMKMQEAIIDLRQPRD